MDEVFSSPLQMPMPQPQQKRGGMFGGNMGNVLAAALAGFVSRRNPMPLQMLMQAQMQKKQGQQDEQNYQRQRQDSMADWQAKQEYENAHRQPSEIEQMAALAGLHPGTPEFAQAMQQAFQNKVNPFTQMRVQNPDGSETLQFMRPPQIPAAPVGNLTPINGGPMPQASGGFPRPY